MAKIAKIIKTSIKNLWHRSTRILIFLLLACLIFVAVGGLSQNSRLKIDRVIVIGADVVSEDAVREFATAKLEGNYYFVYARNNSLIYPQGEIQKGLLQTFVRLASVRTVRIDWHTVAVEVTERVPYAIWCGETFASDAKADLSNCYFVDTTSTIFDHAPAFSSGVYLELYSPLDGAQGENVIGAHIPIARFNTATGIVDGFQKNIGKLLRIAIQPDNEYTATVNISTSYPMLNGVEIRFTDDVGADAVIKNLLAALPVQFPLGQIPKKKLLYIDMRFAKNVVFGFEHASTTPRQ
ncbi:MAG: hypothetical protein PHS95_02505 [Candidatus Pacebacteria bacterium]|nr:hypothetical protein [Candidatus Paceibacterota bacterium]